MSAVVSRWRMQQAYARHSHSTCTHAMMAGESAPYSGCLPGQSIKPPLVHCSAHMRMPAQQPTACQRQAQRQGSQQRSSAHRLLAGNQRVAVHLPPMAVDDHRQAAARLRLQLVVLRAHKRRATWPFQHWGCGCAATCQAAHPAGRPATM